MSFSLGILTLLTLMSFASAAITNLTVTQPQAFNNINSIVPLTFTNTGATPITVNLPQQSLVGTKSTATLTYFTHATTTQITTVTVPAQVGIIPGTITVDVQATPDTNNFMLLQGSNGGTATITDNTIPTPNSNTFFVNFQGNLELTLESTKVINGYGSDQSWFPLDNIEAKVNVANNGNDTIRSIVVKWEVYDATKQKKVVSGEESSMSINDGTDKNLLIDFQLPDTTINNNNDQYVFYAWATGNDQSFTGNPKTYSTTNNIKDLSSIDIVVDSDFIVLSNLQTVNSIVCGNNVQITGTLWNVGSNDEDNVYIKVFNTDLGISQKVNVGTMNAGDSKDLSFNVAIPTNAISGQAYDITFQVFNGDNVIFESSNNDKSQATLTIPITGTCTNAPKALVTTNLQNTPAAGQQFTVTATVTNTDTKANTFNIALNNYNTWASLVSVDQSTLNLNAGQSQTVTVVLQANAGISGDQTFNIVLTQGTQTLTQPVPVSIQSSSTPGTGLFTGLGGNAYLWGIAALNILLVLIIIIVAVRVVRKK